MAEQHDIDLEEQKLPDLDLRPNPPREELLCTDTGNNADPNLIASTERAPHDLQSHVQGTSEYYQDLVKLASADSQLDSYALSFEFLHRLVLLDHQKKLSEHFRDVALDSTTSRAKISEIDSSLNAYTRAAADYKFWRDKKLVRLDTNFQKATSEHPDIRDENGASLPKILSHHKMFIPEMKAIQDFNPGIIEFIPYRSLSSEADHGQKQLTESNGRQQSDTAQVLNHFAIAIVGGISLIVPMLIMALHRSRVTSLVTTSVAVTLFAIVLAFWPVISRRCFPWMKGRTDLIDDQEVLGNKDVLLATAAYAAVLVVFVGASLSTVE